MRHQARSLLLAIGGMVASSAPVPAGAWEAACQTKVVESVALPQRVVDCPEGPALTLLPWLAETSQLDEHRRMLEQAMRDVGIPEELIGNYAHTVFTEASGDMVPVPFDQVTATFGHSRSIPEFAQLPDHGYTLGDYVTGFQTCPPLPGREAALCHRYLDTLAAFNANHFGPQSHAWYRNYHELALTRATECARMRTLLGIEAARFLDFTDECTREALVLEAVGQHYLQDTWSMGHMWPRWGSARITDFAVSADGTVQNTEGALQRGKVVGLIAGVLHGLTPADALASPTPEATFVCAADTSGNARGIGDWNSRRLTEPAFERQRTELETCSKAGLAEVYAMARGAAPAPGPTAGCFTPLATNAALLRGFGVTIPTTQPPTTDEETHLGLLFLDGLGIVSSAITDLPELKTAPVVNALKNLGVRLFVATQGKQGLSTDMAAGGIGSFLGVKPNQELADATLAAVYPEETNDWPVLFSASGAADNSPGGRLDRAAAIPRFFHRGHAIDWCESMTVAQLTELRRRAQGQPQSSPEARVCTEFARRHLQVIPDAVLAQSGAPLDCEPRPGAASTAAGVALTAPLCSLLAPSSARLELRVAPGTEPETLDDAAAIWCTRPNCPADCRDNLSILHVDGFPVRADGSPGGDGTLTRISLGTGVASEILFGADGRLWVNGLGLVSVLPVPTTGIPGAELQPNLTLEVVRYPRGGPQCMAFGPDGNLWFTQFATDQILRVDPRCGLVTGFPLPTSSARPFGITAGADGNLWFTERDAAKIGRITPTGSVTEFALPPCDLCDFLPGIQLSPTSIAAAGDGQLWFLTGGSLSSIDSDGVITKREPDNFIAPVDNCRGIAVGRDGNVWHGLTQFNPLSGTSTTFTDGSTVLPPVARNLALAADGSLWFTESGGRGIGHLSTAGVMRRFPIPVEAGAIAAGPGDEAWFTSASALWRLHPGGVASVPAPPLPAEPVEPDEGDGASDPPNPQPITFDYDPATCAAAAVIDPEDASEQCAFAPCGGPLVGVWRLVGTCARYEDNDPEERVCDVRWPGERDQRETLSFDEAGGFAYERNGVLCHPDVTLAPECKEGTLRGCASYSSGAPGGVTCSEQPDGSCRCVTPAWIISPLRVTGTYSTSGTELELQVSSTAGIVASDYPERDDDEETLYDTPSFCIRGQELQLRGVDGSVSRYVRE